MNFNDKISSIRNEISHKLRVYRKKLNMSQKDLADKLGVQNSSVSNWENGVNSIDIDNLANACKIFGITLNDIYGNNTSNAAPLADNKQVEFTITSDEHDLISKYRRLTPNSKQIIMTLTEMELHHIKATQKGEIPISILNTTKKSLATHIEQSLENKPKEKAEFLKVFNQSAAAGFGDYISDDSSFEMISVPSIPFGTEFGIRISGDSMEPKIHDGDIAFVKRNADMSQDEIGIFIYNGDAFCKQLIYQNGKYYLHSLNEKYKDIPLYGDSIYCVGKVIF